MRLLVFNFEKKFALGNSIEKKKFERWKAVVAALMATATGLLFATYIVSSSSRRKTLSQDQNLTSIEVSQSTEMKSGEEQFLKIARRILPMAQVYCSVRNCIVTCSFIPAASNPGIVAGVFLNSDYTSQCPEKVLIEELIFESCRFPGNALSPGWITGNLQLKKLTFRRCALTVVDQDAFSSNHFERLTSLSIIDNNISVFRKLLFDRLPNLEELVITNNVIQQAEADLLAGTANALQIIQIDYAIYSENTLINITGKTLLPKVLLLSLTGNFINTISVDVFNGLPNVQSIYLTNSAIFSIAAGAFEPFSDSVRQLFLSDNKLSSLPDDIFESILKYNPNFKLAISNNNWNCSCELRWLQNLTHALAILGDEPRCASPEWNAMLTISEADFCGVENTNDTNITSRPSPSTYSNDTSVTTEQIDVDDGVKPSDKNLITLLCTDDEETPKSSGRKLLSTQEFMFQSRLPAFAVQESENGSTYVRLKTTSLGYTLIWFCNDFDEPNPDLGSISCITNVKESLYLNQLRPGVLYTICILDMPRDLTSPFNCLSFQKRPHYEDAMWLANEDKTLIIFGVAIVLIFACIVSVLGSYCVVRRNPSLLKGSKRIIMVRHRTADAIVLPEGLRLDSGKDFGSALRDESTPSRLSSQKDYMTPMSKRRLLARKSSVISRASTQSSSTSYVSGIEPTSMQLMSWRIGRIREILSCDNPSEQNDAPPPLPPPRNKSIPSLSLNVDKRVNAEDQTSIPIPTPSTNDHHDNSNDFNDQARL